MRAFMGNSDSSKAINGTAMKSDLTNHINIGKDTAARLIAAGIDTFAGLRHLGTEKAFLKLMDNDPGACLSLLYGLQGAIEGVKWNKLSPERKRELQEFHKAVRKR